MSYLVTSDRNRLIALFTPLSHQLRIFIPGHTFSPSSSRNYFTEPNLIRNVQWNRPDLDSNLVPRISRQVLDQLNYMYLAISNRPPLASTKIVNFLIPKLWLSSEPCMVYDKRTKLHPLCTKTFLALG